MELHVTSQINSGSTYSFSRTFEIDITPPLQPTVVGTANGLVGTAQAGSTVLLYVTQGDDVLLDNVEIVDTSSGTWEYNDLPLSGQYTVKVAARGLCG